MSRREARVSASEITFAANYANTLAHENPEMASIINRALIELGDVQRERQQAEQQRDEARAERDVKGRAGQQMALELRRAGEDLATARQEIAAQDERAERYAMEAVNLTERLMAAEQEITTLRAQYRAAVERIEALEAYLRDHGRHDDMCGALSGYPERGACDCGLDAILTPASPDTAPVGEARCACWLDSRGLLVPCAEHEPQPPTAARGEGTE
jgi:hypothetical protein